MQDPKQSTPRERYPTRDELEQEHDMPGMSRGQLREAFVPSRAAQAERAEDED